AGRRRAPRRDGPGGRRPGTVRGDRVFRHPGRARAGRGDVLKPLAGQGGREAVPLRPLVLLPAGSPYEPELRRPGRPRAQNDHRAPLVERGGPAGGDRADRAARPREPDGPATARRHPRASGPAAQADLGRSAAHDREPDGQRHHASPRYESVRGAHAMPRFAGFRGRSTRFAAAAPSQGTRVARRLPSGPAWNTGALGPRSRTAARSPGSGSESLTRAAASSDSAPLDTAIATASRSADRRSDGRATAAAV